jgi:hypothetical protein
LTQLWPSLIVITSPAYPESVSRQLSDTMSLRRQLLAIAIIFAAAPAVAEEPPTIVFARMSGKCSMLRVAGRGFSCRAVSFYQTEIGRANFTVVLDDPTDSRHIITFSGDNGRRLDNMYELPVDRMLLKSKDRPKMDGLPVPQVETSTGMCRQLGSFVSGQISSISCSATDQSGRTYEVQFESDGSPVKLWRVRPSRPSIQ